MTLILIEVSFILSVSSFLSETVGSQMVKKGLNRFGGKLSKEEGGISLKDSQKKRIFWRSDFMKSIGIIHPGHPVIFPRL